MIVVYEHLTVVHLAHCHNQAVVSLFGQTDEANVGQMIHFGKTQLEGFVSDLFNACVQE